MKQAATLVANNVTCLQCHRKARCLPQDFDRDELAAFATALRQKKTLSRGEVIFSQGDTFNALYLVRSGSLKAYSLEEDGFEQVVGFFLPGDVAGLDAIGGVHPTYAVALETSSVCVFDYDQLESLARRLDRLQIRFNRLFGAEIARDQELLRLLGKKSAERRLAGFLLSLSRRLSERGFSSHELQLSMSRHDIAGHLGLAVETVSRLLTRLQAAGVLRVDRRSIVIQEPPALQALAGETPAARATVATAKAV